MRYARSTPVIHVYASQPNYWRHLAPIVDELRARGHDVETWASRPPQPWGARITPSGFRNPDLVVVASWIDARRWPGLPVVYVEHGAGQTYQDGASDCYAGAGGLAHVRLFIAPGEHVAQRWRESYPQVPVETVGCPALDSHFFARSCQPARDSDVEGTRSPVEPLVVVTAHWRCGVCPETMPALPIYEAQLRSLLANSQQPMTWVGHAHPRAGRRAREMFDRLGIPFEVDVDVALNRLCLSRNALLVADNTSVMYEAAALDVPVLALNAPTYRRDVEHGLRFWDRVPGLHVDEPRDLEAGIVHALADPPEARALRARAAAHTYAHRDGSSSRRAAEAIEKVL